MEYSIILVGISNQRKVAIFYNKKINLKPKRN